MKNHFQAPNTMTLHNGFHSSPHLYFTSHLFSSTYDRGTRQLLKGLPSHHSKQGRPPGGNPLKSMGLGNSKKKYSMLMYIFIGKCYKGLRVGSVQ